MRLYARRAHYREHARPVMDRLPPELAADDSIAVVMSYADLLAARRDGPWRGIARLAHGAGQAYPGRVQDSTDPFCSGGRDHKDVSLFLCPNEYARQRWAQAYPDAKARVIGALAERPGRHPGPSPTVAVSFRYEHPTIPEQRSAFPHYRDQLRDLAKRFHVLGHGHPRAMDTLRPAYLDAGIEVVESFDEVCARADLYACDNSSTLYEWARQDRPVVVLDAPWYDRSVVHGLRFWDQANVGVRIGAPEQLVGAVAAALQDAPVLRDRRRRHAWTVLPYLDGAPRAVYELQLWAHEIGG